LLGHQVALLLIKWRFAWFARPVIDWKFCKIATRKND